MQSQLNNVKYIIYTNDYMQITYFWSKELVDIALKMFSLLDAITYQGVNTEKVSRI